MRLEDLTPGAHILRVAVDGPVTVVAVTWIGGNALRLSYRADAGSLDECRLYCDHEPPGSGQARCCGSSSGDVTYTTGGIRPFLLSVPAALIPAALLGFYKASMGVQ
jgi:hypothetical protein